MSGERSGRKNTPELKCQAPTSASGTDIATSAQTTRRIRTVVVSTPTSSQKIAIALE